MPSLPSGIARHCPLTARAMHSCRASFVRAIASTAGASAAGAVLGHLLCQPLTHRVAVQRLTGIDLPQAGLDLADGPIVEFDRAFECFLGEHFHRHTAAHAAAASLPSSSAGRCSSIASSVVAGHMPSTRDPSGRRGPGRPTDAGNSRPIGPQVRRRLNARRTASRTASSSLPTSSARNRRTKYPFSCSRWSLRRSRR